VVNELCFSALKKPVKRVCGLRTGVPYGAVLEKAVVPNPDWIIAGVRQVLA
jgi:pyruvate/2-oxoglutarate/acetoin dehydrogenase E1 component